MLDCFGRFRSSWYAECHHAPLSSRPFVNSSSERRDCSLTRLCASWNMTSSIWQLGWLNHHLPHLLRFGVLLLVLQIHFLHDLFHQTPGAPVTQEEHVDKRILNLRSTRSIGPEIGTSSKNTSNFSLINLAIAVAKGMWPCPSGLANRDLCIPARLSMMSSTCPLPCTIDDSPQLETMNAIYLLQA